MHTRSIGTVAVVLALAAAGSGARAGGPSGLVAGAARENITPYTHLTTSDALSAPAASNPDGEPGGLWHSFAPEPGFASAGQVTVSGLWGEPFEDLDGNNRHDYGEPWVDDPANARLDPDSAGKWDGVYLAGFGGNRVPRGAFDPIWARAVYVRDASGLAVAFASIDVLGWFSDWNDRIVALARSLEPSLDLDHLIVSHTHDHESVDTHVGIWGEVIVRDGTYPKYERYIELKLAQAVVRAARAAVPARFRFGEITPGTKFTTVRGTPNEDLEGLQSRNSCRTPWVFDDELRAAQVAAAPSGPTIATIVNWGTHVESMEGGNQYLSSDFAHTIRATVEQALGGMALFVPGAQGAGEVVGDSCTRRWRRTTFDGQTFPVDAGGEPDAVRNAATDPLPARDRAYAIGRVAGSAAVAALNAANWDPGATAIEGFSVRELFVPVNNEALGGLAAIGVIDKPAYIGGVSVGGAAGSAAGTFASAPSGTDARTAVYAWRIGSASFVTAPGELFPEIWWGLAAHNRAVGGTAGHFDYESPNPAALACSARAFSYGTSPGARTPRAFEPGVRAALVRKWGNPHNFLLGYTPDLLGYIVPGYDFAWYAQPPAHGVGIGAIHGEAPDPCATIPPDSAFANARYGRHYQETNSAGSMLAPAYACTVWDMLGLDPAASAEGDDACDDWEGWRNAGGLAHLGADPSVCDPVSETECVRHY